MNIQELKMHDSVSNLINEAIKEILDKSSSKAKINKLSKTHNEKVHFIPKRYRVFGGMLQSMNIQFGNFIEVLMALLIENDEKYEVVSAYSGKKSNSFKLSKNNDQIIDKYITNCQTEKDGYCKTEFPKLLKTIIEDSDSELNNFKHDIDLLFKDKSTNQYYYLEVKYNDDHDTGKFVDINRKFIKTYAYLVRELEITKANSLVPILFFFNNKRLKGNPYLPEDVNIKRGKKFFDEFLEVKYEDVNRYMENVSESPLNIEMFNALYRKIVIPD